VERGRLRSNTYFVAPRTHPPLHGPGAHPHRICYTHVMRFSLRLAGSCSPAAVSPPIPAVGLASSQSIAELPEHEHKRGGQTCSLLMRMHRSEFVPRERCAPAMRCRSTTPQIAVRRTMLSRGDRAESRMSGEYGVYETLRKRAGSGGPGV
jgi:hypothetical protein